MKMLLMCGVAVLAGFSSGCLVRDTVAEDEEAVSERYEMEEPMHNQTYPIR